MTGVRALPGEELLGPEDRKKAKGKAPLPPGEARYSDSLPTLELADAVQHNMDQKENIDQDIQLKVLLPGDRHATTIIHGSKPMMDLLVYLCGQYHLNPSTYTIDVISADKTQLKYKPNTPIGMLDVERVVLKSKVDEKNKKPGPTMPEQTVRVVINYRKTQKTVMRVSPFIPLQDLLPSICDKCEFEPQSTVLLQDYQSQKPLDITKSLNDLGLRELYAMDHSKATSPTEIRPSPLQESFQNIEIKQNDDKGFFNFFRRSTKKKRDQTSSAPATPMLNNKPRPQNVVRANTVTKTYDTNTLPSDGPKKRRAPLPPMYPPQNSSSDIHRGQIRTKSCVVKSVSVEESEKAFTGIDRSRTGSFQHSVTSSFNSSLRRTKRKAPLPPSPPPQAPLEISEDHSNVTEVSEERIHVKASDDYNVQETSPTEPELREIEEKAASSVSVHKEADSISKENVNGSTKEEMSLSSTEEHPDSRSAEVDKSAASDTHNSSLLSDVEEISKITQDDITANGTSSLFIKDEAATENTTLEYEKIGESENRTSTPTSELESHHVFENKVVVVVAEEASQTLPFVKSTETTAAVTEDSGYINLTETTVDTELKQSIIEKGKMQDSAVQTVNFDSDVETTMDKEITHSQGNTFTDRVQHELNGHGSNVAQLSEQQYKHELVNNVRESVETQTVNVQENMVESSQSKTFHFYRQHSDTKPKPSNEVTRDYLPKVGMTTYKIIPQRSFDVERYVDEEEPSHAVPNSNMAFHYNLSHEKSEPPPVVKNGDLSSRGSNVNTLSMVSKTTADQRKEHFALSRSLSSAPVLTSDKTSPPEVKPKPKPTSPVKGPSSFYLQMQRRASSMYVTSAIAKAKTSVNPSNSTVKIKDLGNEASQITVRTLPTRVNVLNFPSKLEDKLPEDKPPLPGTYTDIKNGSLQTISETQSELINHVTVSQVSTEKDSIQRELSDELFYQPRVVESWQEKRPDVSILEQKLLETRNVVREVTFAEKPSLIVENEWRPEIVSSTSSTKTVQSSISPTSQNPPLTLPKLSNFVTPRPFLSSHSSSVTSMVKRSQSFTSGTSPTKSPSSMDAPIGWSSVTSPSETKKDSLVFSAIPQEEIEDETLTNPQLKYRVHSPPPIPEKKPSVSFQSSDPEQLRQDIMAAIRSGQAAANLKRITIRSNTISINGKSRLSHPVFSETLPED
ncbi:cordon-bleu protein-like 1 isoform X2 [Dendropsophus ebraccatus]|uniref:cordon-bleu protein-like 1 isoform X2 n=1 Tax=Dendropsophus ebraccatus TaxID=150705 RepID=UPI003831CFC4